MSNRKARLSASSSSLVIIAASKGGVGKSTLATLIADVAMLDEHPMIAYQVDDQRRLGSMLGARVHTITPDYEAAMRSPRALTTPFSGLYNACAEAGRGGPSILLDVGANRVDLVAMWMRRAELQEDLTAWRVRPVIFVPAPVEAEALRQAAATIRLFDAALPEATIVFVENQRDGRIADLKPSSEAASVLREDVRPTLGDRPHLVMPLIEGDAWASYENHNLRFIKAMSMAPAEAAALMGEEIADAKIMRSAVTMFVRHMRQELAGVISFAKGTI